MYWLLSVSCNQRNLLRKINYTRCTVLKTFNKERFCSRTCTSKPASDAANQPASTNRKEYITDAFFLKDILFPACRNYSLNSHTNPYICYRASCVWVSCCVISIYLSLHFMKGPTYRGQERPLDSFHIHCFRCIFSIL